MFKVKKLTKVILATTFLAAQVAAIVGFASTSPSFDAEIDKMFGTQNQYVEIDHAQLFCLAQNIYFEAREYWNRDVSAMEAVGHVTINRVANERFPNTICDVVYQGPLDGSAISRHRCQFSWFCDGKSDRVPVSDNIIEVRAWEKSREVAERLLRGNIEDTTHGSTYYHASYVSPNWSKVYERMTEIGNHYFYKH